MLLELEIQLDMLLKFRKEDHYWILRESVSDRAADGQPTRRVWLNPMNETITHWTLNNRIKTWFGYSKLFIPNFWSLDAGIAHFLLERRIPHQKLNMVITGNVQNPKTQPKMYFSMWSFSNWVIGLMAMPNFSGEASGVFLTLLICFDGNCLSVSQTREPNQPLSRPHSFFVLFCKSLKFCLFLRIYIYI